MTSLGYRVHLNRTHVGHLVERPDGVWAFTFASTYRELTHRPVLGQKFEDDLEKSYTGKKPGRLPSFFAHLVPEGPLRRLLERSLKLEDPTDAELLAAASPDLPGAISLTANFGEPPEVDTESSAPESEPPSTDNGGPRFSLGGNQLKFSMLRTGDRFTLPAHGSFGSWIVKIALNRFEGLAANEFAILEWARHAGFDVPETRLLEHRDLGSLTAWIEPGSSALAIRRYDRKGRVKIHQEDFAQVIGTEPTPSGGDKYQQTYDNLVKLTTKIAGQDAGIEQLARIAFIVASGNSDAHLKNFSLLYEDGITPSLSPIYDQVATIAWPTVDTELALKLASTRDFGTVRLGSFEHIGRKAGLNPTKCTEVISQRLARIRDAWPKALGAGLPAEHADAIRAHWTRVPVLRDHGKLQ